MTRPPIPDPDPHEGWPHEVASAGSRLLNALTGGDGGVTLSARAGDMAMDGRPGLARCIDGLWFNRQDPDHCETWRRWHALRGLLPLREGDVGRLVDREAVADARAADRWTGAT